MYGSQKSDRDVADDLNATSTRPLEALFQWKSHFIFRARDRVRRDDLAAVLRFPVPLL